jgi:hypothetical protein
LVGQRETQAAAAKRFMIVESVFNTVLQHYMVLN